MKRNKPNMVQVNLSPEDTARLDWLARGKRRSRAAEGGIYVEEGIRRELEAIGVDDIPQGGTHE